MVGGVLGVDSDTYTDFLQMYKMLLCPCSEF